MTNRYPLLTVHDYQRKGLAMVDGLNDPDDIDARGDYLIWSSLEVYVMDVVAEMSWKDSRSRW